MLSPKSDYLVILQQPSCSCPSFRMGASRISPCRSAAAVQRAHPSFLYRNMHVAALSFLSRYERWTRQGTAARIHALKANYSPYPFKALLPLRRSRKRDKISKVSANQSRLSQSLGLAQQVVERRCRWLACFSCARPAAERTHGQATEQKLSRGVARGPDKRKGEGEAEFSQGVPAAPLPSTALKKDADQRYVRSPQ